MLWIENISWLCVAKGGSLILPRLLSLHQFPWIIHLLFCLARSHFLKSANFVLASSHTLPHLVIHLRFLLADVCKTRSSWRKTLTDNRRPNRVEGTFEKAACIAANTWKREALTDLHQTNRNKKRNCQILGYYDRALDLPSPSSFMA